MVDTAEEDKTEQPTGKRLNDVREEGNLPVSRETATWVVFVAGLLVVVWFGPEMGHGLRTSLQTFLERPHQISLEDGGLQDVLLGVLASAALQISVVFGLFLAACFLGTMVQTDFYVNPNLVKFDPSKLLKMNFFKNLFSIHSLVELVKSFLKMVVLGYVAYRILRPIADELPMLVDVPLVQGLEFLHSKIIRVIVYLMIVITMIAIADLVYTRFSYIKNLKMSRQEIKDEHKQLEGDPVVKNRIRRLRIEKARQRMMANVPKADVVITNPTHYAVALQYDSAKMAAPVVTAKGINLIAQKIREIAEENEVPLVSNPPLARALYDTVDLDEPITPEHYRAVAEVISYVYKIKNKNSTKKPH